MALLPSAPVWAVWEHAPICGDTRLPSPDSARWEYGMVYTLETLYPAEFSCPAGAAVVIHFLNLSPRTVSLKFEKPRQVETISPKAYRRFDLGRQPAGENIFFLEFPEAGDDCEPHCPYETAAQMRCVVRASTWPETEFIYRAAVIMRGPDILPGVSRLPAGRYCELFIASTSPSTTAWQASGYALAAKPNEVTLTELSRPKGQIISGIFNSKAKIVIR